MRDPVGIKYLNQFENTSLSSVTGRFMYPKKKEKYRAWKKSRQPVIVHTAVFLH